MKKRNIISTIEDLLGLNRPDEDATLQKWREYSFEVVLNASVGLGLLIYLTMAVTLVKRGEWITLTVDTITYFVGVLAIRYVFKDSAYRTRVILLLVVLYVTGIYLGMTKTAIGDGRIWLLFMSTLAAIFLGIKPGIIAVTLITISWLLLGVLFQHELIGDYDHLTFLVRPENYLLWVNTSVTMGLGGLTIMATLAAIQRNLNESLEQSRSLAKKLRQEEKKYRLLVNNSPDLIMEIEVNHNFQIVACNPAMAKSLGYENDDLIGTHLMEILPEKIVEQRSVFATRAHSQNRTIQFEDERDGRHFHTVFIPNVERNTIQVVAHDITERKEAQAELLRYQQELEKLVEERNVKLRQEVAERERAEKMAMAVQKLADLGMLTTGVAHELNSPLQGMQSVCDYLLMDLDESCSDPVSLREQIEIIQESISRCTKIVRSLRFYTHVSPKDYAEQEIDDLVHNTLLLAKHHLRHVDISIVTELADDMPPLICSRDQIMQVLINLLTNARDAMPEGGEIIIQVDHKPDQRHFELRVIDNGEGIPPEHQDQIYKPFFTTKPVGEGTGLGLFIVSGIVHAHGGELDIESSPGEGTTVTLTLAEEPPREVPSSVYGRYTDFMA